MGSMQQLAWQPSRKLHRERNRKETMQVEGGGVADFTMPCLMPRKMLRHGKFGGEGCGVGGLTMPIWTTMIVGMLLLMHRTMKLWTKSNCSRLKKKSTWKRLTFHSENGLHRKEHEGRCSENSGIFSFHLPKMTKMIPMKINRITRPKKRPRKQIPIYEERIRTMCSSNLATLDLSYLHLMQKEPTLAIWIVDAPRDMLDVLNEAVTRHTLRIFPSYRSIQDEIHVRIAELPIMDSIRALRRNHLDRLIRVNGVVTRRSGVYPQLKSAYYDCTQCKTTLGPYRVDESNSSSSSSTNGGDADAAAALHQPSTCPSCDGNGPFRINTTRTEYRNYQKVNLQETPGSVPPGRVPRTKEVIFTNDLIDVARPGEEVEITGIYAHSYDYHLTQKSGFPVFSTFIHANHVRRKEDASAAANLTEGDKAQILELARDPKIGERIIASIAPSIYGHRHVKMALAMSLFGAVPKNICDKHRIRGDINVLLLGDPGTAKSQMLKYAEHTAPRAVYSTGKGASAVGLTASVHKDPVTREWTLEGGALVLADRGVCLIDEFDKMNEQDRTSIHEAMEQQSISVSKAGLVTSLQARCSVLAAANPVKGRYDSSLSFEDNVDLTQPILSRFDCICVVKDSVDVVKDERLAEFVVKSPRDTHPDAQDDAAMETNAQAEQATAIDQTLLRKYLMHARHSCRPVLQDIDQNKLVQVYTELRQEANNGGVVVAVRHIESMIRMAEASARMHLRNHVSTDDVDLAISVLLNSVIKSQKYAIARSMEKKFYRYLTQKKDAHQLLEFSLRKLFQHAAHNVYARRRTEGEADEAEGAAIVEVELDEFEARAREMAISDLSTFYASRQFGSYRHAKSAENRAVIVRAEDESRARARHAAAQGSAAAAHEAEQEAAAQDAAAAAAAAAGGAAQGAQASSFATEQR